VTSWLLHSFVAISLLILLVLALRRPVARLFGAGWAYALWLIPAFRLILPPLPLPAQDLPPSAAVLIPAAADMAAPPLVFAGPGQWVPFLLATWAGGAVIFLILQWLGYRAFLRRLDTARPARPPRYGGIATFVSRMVEGPLALGLIQRRIVIPSDFSRRYSPGERRLAMEHELTHHRHRDIWWNVAAILILAVNWFNPLAWLAYRAFRADQELACDAAVAARATIEERCDYARALVKSATSPRLIAACPINGAGTLKRRLKMLRGHRASPARSAGGAAALTILAVAGATSAGLRSAPEEMPQFVAQAAASVVMVPQAPVRVAAAAAALRGEPVSTVIVRVRHVARHAARRLPPASVPQLAQEQIEPKLRQAASEPDMPRLQLALARSMRLTRVALAAPERRIVFARVENGNETVVYRVADLETRALLEAAIRDAVAEAHDARAETRIAVHLAQAPNPPGGGGTWTAFNLQFIVQ
jgi:bla regulator protein BlaR1